MNDTLKKSVIVAGTVSLLTVELWGNKFDFIHQKIELNPHTHNETPGTPLNRYALMGANMSTSSVISAFNI